MSGITTIEEARLRAAAEWWLRLREPEVSDATLLQWIAWSAREENLAAFERVGILADDVEHLDDASRALLTIASRPRQRSKVAASRDCMASPCAANASIASATLPLSGEFGSRAIKACRRILRASFSRSSPSSASSSCATSLSTSSNPELTATSANPSYYLG